MYNTLIIRAPNGHTNNCSSLQDLILLGIFSFGYLSGGFATALLADGSWKELSSFYNNAAILTTDSSQAEVYKEIANNLPVSMVYDTCALVSVS